MKISFIVVSYNEIEYLKAAIDSCLSQEIWNEDKEAEVIIGDDGSDDGSIELIKTMVAECPEKIKYFVMERPEPQIIIPSLRVSNVIKRALAMASGDYIQILSADDLLLDSEKASSAVGFLENHPDYSCCYTDYKKFWDDGRDKYPGDKMHSFSRPVLWALKYCHISCYVFRKSVTEDLLDRLCDDTGMFYSCYVSGKAKYLPGVSFGYRQRSSGIMHSSDDIEKNIMELLLFQDTLNKGGYPKSTKARFCLPLIRVWKRRKSLPDNKFEKYMLESQKCDNDILGRVANYDRMHRMDKSKLCILMIKCGFCRAFFQCLGFWESIIR